MQSLLSTDNVPPANNLDYNFRWTDPLTGYTVSSRTYYDWVDLAKKHRRANGHAIPIDFESQMQNQLCEQLPPGWCERAPEEGWINTRFSWQDILNGMKAFAALMKGGFNFVSQEEADRRARICVTCYLNQPVPGCSTCGKIAQLASGEVAKRHTVWDEKLRACAVCHCALSVMAHFPLRALEATSTPDKDKFYPKEFCWRAKESPNYKPDGTTENKVPD